MKNSTKFGEGKELLEESLEGLLDDGLLQIIVDKEKDCEFNGEAYKVNSVTRSFKIVGQNHTAEIEITELK